MHHAAKKLIHKLAEADMVFWLMPPLMILLIVGTIAQRWMGLWPAMDMFFSSFIIWAGPIPLHGAYILLGLLSLTLSLKFLFKSEWRWQKSGIILSHLGALTLLCGGLLTAMTARESYMIIPEGQETPFMYSYSERDLAIFEEQKLLVNLPYDEIETWDISALPFMIITHMHCENCEILKRAEMPG